MTALTSDKGDPLLAHWQQGLGRVVAWTSDTSGPWTEEWRSWPEAERFWQQAVRWTFPEPTRATFPVAAEVVGDQVTLRAQSVRPDGRFGDLLDTRVTIVAPDGSARELPTAADRARDLRAGHDDRRSRGRTRRASSSTRAASRPARRRSGSRSTAAPSSARSGSTRRCWSAWLPGRADARSWTRRRRSTAPIASRARSRRRSGGGSRWRRCCWCRWTWRSVGSASAAARPTPAPARSVGRCGAGRSATAPVSS